MQAIGSGAYSLNIERDVIEVTSERESLDVTWRYVDSQGHEHRYASGLPTLNHIVDERHWCDGTEGRGNHDPHWHIDESHYECTECGEVVAPGTVPPFTRQFIPGSITATLGGPSGPGERVEVWLTAEECQDMLSSGDDFPFDAWAAERLRLAARDGRVINRTVVA